MKSLFTLLTITAISFFVIACSESSAEEAHEHEQHSSQTPATKITNMTLNNGQKWQLDDSTRAILAQMKSTVKLANITSAQAEALKVLGQDLTLQLDNLIQGCTMQGAEHDQLHIFLTAYIPELKALTSTGSSEAAKNVDYYLNNYSHYFQ